MKYFLFFIVVYLTSCGDSVKPVSKEQKYSTIEETADNPTPTGEGTIIATVHRQNTPFHAFYFRITQILLVNSVTGNTIPLTPPNNQININHSSIFEYSEILAINHKVPEGNYNEVYITLSFDNSLILPANQPESQFQLVDVTLAKIPEEKSDFLINAYIGNQEEISVTSNKTSHIEFAFDIEASTKYILLDEKKLGIMLIPQMTITKAPSNRKIHINGRLDSLTNTHLDITHLYKIRPKVPERVARYTYTIDNPVIFYNGIAENNLRFDIRAPWIDLYGSMMTKDEDISLSIDHVSFVDSLSELKQFQGIVVENKQKELIVSGFMNSIGYTNHPIRSKLINQAIHIKDDTLFYHEGDLNILGKDIKITTGQSVRMTLHSQDGKFYAHSIYIQPSRVLGEITSISKSRTAKIKIKPLSYNNTDRTSSNYTDFFDNEITLKKSNRTYKVGKLLDLKGYQTNDTGHTFHSLTADVIKPSEQLVFSISLPTVPVFTGMELINENSMAININEKIYDNSAFLKVRLEKSNAQYRNIKNISSVTMKSIADNDMKFTVSIDGTDPIQSFMFDDVNEFFTFINPKINNEKFFFNEVVFYGNINNDKMTSNRLSLVIVDNERKKPEPEPVSDTDSNSDQTLLNNEGMRTFLAVALPVLVPIGIATTISLVTGTISKFFKNLSSTITIKKNNKQIKEKIQEFKTKNISSLLTKLKNVDSANKTFNRQIDDFIKIFEEQNAQEIKDYDISDLKKSPEAGRFEAIISLLKINRDSFSLLYSQSRNTEIKELIITHNTLIDYLKGFRDNEDIKNKINNANDQYNKLIDKSKNIHSSLINNLSRVDENRKSITIEIDIDEYTRTIDKFFISNNKKRVINPDDMDKTHMKNMHSKMQNQMHSNIRIRNTHK